ncbi:GtrA family protein [Falsarthrobacter nasiphocae]|uniref:Flippase GtrA n=1 Tax=Falsarthrobacter nasiphocae TaxID=189863 RepID=A0AAE3YHU4_9MICC|nr:GtrA family protein [Falsarthrobacter nasiphocae]MDR6892021.1 putative flippase GtrA [Falsarthrobacter nasiphocae]
MTSSPASGRLAGLRQNQFIRFAMTGVANTAIYYVLYLLLLLVAPYLVAHVVAWVSGMVFSFFANCVFTFKVRPTWGRFLAFLGAPLMTLALSSVLSWLFVDVWGVSDVVGPLLASLVSMPVSFLATKLLLTNSRHDRATPVV